MKKLLLVTILMVSSLIIGQEKQEKLNFKKGTWAFGGDTSLSTTNNKHEYEGTHYKVALTTFSISPKTGYFIKPNLEVGLGLGYSHMNSNNDNNSDSKINSFTIYPYVKKYLPISNSFSFFLQGELAYSTSKSKSTNNNNYYSNYKSNSFMAGFRPGIMYLFTKNVAMHANIGFLGYFNLRTKREENSSEKSNSNNFSFNLNSSNLAFGLTYYL